MPKMPRTRITNISNHLSTRKLKQLAIDPTRTKLDKHKANRLLLMRGVTVTL